MRPSVTCGPKGMGPGGDENRDKNRKRQEAGEKRGGRLPSRARGLRGDRVEVREFQDVAAAAAKVVAGQSRFERIYLLNAVEPGLEAFEIFPAPVKCE